MNIGEARDVNKLLLWATEGHRRGGWAVTSAEAAEAARRLADRTYKTLMHTGQGCGLQGADLGGLRETAGAFRDYVRLILEHAPTVWISEPAAASLAIDYVRQLEAVSRRFLGRLPELGENIEAATAAAEAEL